jgi:hypothetical protein
LICNNRNVDKKPANCIGVFCPCLTRGGHRTNPCASVSIRGPLG